MLPARYASTDPDAIALSFHESLLRKSDIYLLTGPHWLNDQIISFYMEYLENVTFAAHQHRLLFVSPEVTQCLKLVEPAEIYVFLHPLNAHEKDFIFFALNDHQEDTVGGSHWTLLVYSRPENAFFHFDSAATELSRGPRKFAERISEALVCPSGNRTISGKCAPQTNGYDCGIHVLCNIELLAQYAIACGRIDGAPVVSAADVRSKRSQILHLINELAD